MNIDYDKLVSIKNIGQMADFELSSEEIIDAKTMVNQAAAWLSGFAWVKKIKDVYVGMALPGVLCVCLFEIEPANENVDSWLWVVYGDVPPAYLVVDNTPNYKSVLQNYVYEINAWVDAVEAGERIDELIPVNAIPTESNAELLKRRLSFIEDNLIKK